jgi:hypothetical protein
MKRLLLVVTLCASCSTTPAADDRASASTTPAAGPLVLSCCGSSDSVLMAQMERFENTPERQRSPELSIFPYRMTSGITRKDRIIVRDAAAWTAIWPQVVGSHSPRPDQPTVDFGRETIVVASMGQRSSGGYSVTIDSAGVAGDTVILAVTERSPGPTCGTTAALSQPIALARVLRPNAVIRFVEKSVVTDCG